MFFFSLSHHFLLHCILYKTCLQLGILSLHSRMAEGLLGWCLASVNLKHLISYTLALRLFLPSYLLTPCSTVLLKKLTGSQLVKKFPAFYGTQRFVTAFTSACYLFLPEPDQSTPCPIPLPEDPS